MRRQAAEERGGMAAVQEDELLPAHVPEAPVEIIGAQGPLVYVQAARGPVAAVIEHEHRILGVDRSEGVEHAEYGFPGGRGFIEPRDVPAELLPALEGALHAAKVVFHAAEHG